MNNKILILGKIPPPIGGVTIHVQRLIESLKRDKFNFKFINLTSINLLLLPFSLVNYKLVHLHTSSIMVQNYVSFICKVFKVRCIVTFHGDLNRFDEVNLSKVKKIIRRISVPIVLNNGSFQTASEINKKTVLVSSFIPPAKSDLLGNEILNLINKAKEKYFKIYVTNAYGLTYDKDKNEIYGIMDLISYFNNKPNLALVISDPSKQYHNFITENKITLKGNVFLISENHSFYEVLKLADASIRNTSTDGDSISLKESLYLSKITFATDIVSRPPGTQLYTRGQYDFEIHDIVKNIEEELSGFNKLKEIYRQILNETNYTVL